MNEYTFLTSNGYRTRHVHANSLRQAIKTTIYYYQGKSEELAKLGTIYLDYYQMARPGEMVMSGWKQSQDKQIKGKTWSNDNQTADLPGGGTMKKKLVMQTYKKLLRVKKKKLDAGVSWKVKMNKSIKTQIESLLDQLVVLVDSTDEIEGKDKIYIINRCTEIIKRIKG